MAVPRAPQSSMMERITVISGWLRATRGSMALRTLPAVRTRSCSSRAFSIPGVSGRQSLPCRSNSANKAGVDTEKSGLAMQ